MHKEPVDFCSYTPLLNAELRTCRRTSCEPIRNGCKLFTESPFDALVAAQAERMLPQAYRLLVILTCLTTSIVGCQLQEHPPALEAAWQTSFDAFVERVGRVARESEPANPEEMHERLNEVWPMTDGAGYVVDCNAPRGTLQYELNQLFNGKHVEWEIPVHRVVWADSDRQAVFVTASLKEYKSDANGSIFPQWIKIRLSGGKAPSEGAELVVNGILKKPSTMDGQCRLAGVCVVYFIDNKREEYGLLIVLGQQWCRGAVGSKKPNEVQIGEEKRSRTFSPVDKAA